MSLRINFSEKQQEISYNLSVCVISLQIGQEKSKLLIRPHKKRDLTFLGESSLLYVTTLPGLVVIGIVEVRIKCS